MRGGIAVVDDLSMDRKNLLHDLNAWIASHPEAKGLRTEGFEDGLSMLENGGLAGRFSIVFLDIRMEGMDGLETARRLRNAQTECLIVFVTTEESYSLQAYPLHPFDYLVKPYARERLDRLMNDILRIVNRDADQIDIHIPYGSVTLPVRQIISVVANGHGVRMTLTDRGELIAVNSFAEMSAKLAQWPCFLNINRGILINMDQALCIHDSHVQMSGNLRYPLRVKEQGTLIRQFTQYQIQHRMGGM